MNTSEKDIWNFLIKNKYIECHDFTSIYFIKNIAVKLYQKNIKHAILIIDVQFIEYFDVYSLIKYIEKIYIKSESKEIINILIDKFIKSCHNIKKQFSINETDFCDMIIDILKYTLNDYKLLNDLISIFDKVYSISKYTPGLAHYHAVSYFNVNCHINPLMLTEYNFLELYAIEKIIVFGT